MPAAEIRVKGAREHNLRDVSIVLPRNQLICFTGVSGSGKSSLSFDTLYAEGQRRYVESLSSYARHFMGQLPKPDVDQITGLSPSISISQKSTGHNPRSTVGTITEIYDFLRVLYARVGTGHCPRCRCEIAAQTREQIVGRIAQADEAVPLAILAPLARNQKGEFRELFEDLRRQGYGRARVDGRVIRLSEPPALDRLRKHNVEVVIDRFTAGARQRGRIAEAVDQALKIGSGSLVLLHAHGNPSAGDDDSWDDAEEQLLSSEYACPECGESFPAPSPQLFSFNSPQGMCSGCDGLGHLYTFVPEMLIPDPTLSLKGGAIELIGKWADVPRFLRSAFIAFANAFEAEAKVEANKLLAMPWNEVPHALTQSWLWGPDATEEGRRLFATRTGRYLKENFPGLIPSFIAKYKESKNPLLLKQYEKYMDTLACPDCAGARLNPQARSVTVKSLIDQFKAPLSLPEICELSISEASAFFEKLDLNDTNQFIATEAIKEIRARLGFLLGVGLDYLTLSRTAPTLSGGESQRIRLAGQIGSGLVGVLYILDEPSIGLHPRDNQRLIDTLLRLRDAGNTLVVVEHDEDTMRAADLVVDFGPGPGVRGGKVVAQGTVDELAKNSKSLTGKYLSGKEQIEIPTERRPVGERWLTIRGARHNNLKNVDVSIPLGAFVCVTGVSGSGKSSLIGDILEPALRRDLNHGECEPGEFDGFTGLEHLDKMVAIDQTPIGRTPRSNPATYVKVFDEIRNLFTQMPEAKKRGFSPGRFSFNVDGGRCSACDGNGSNRLEMDFLADVWVTCPVCEGRRYNRETLEVKFKDHSIADVLALDISEARKLFADIPKIYESLTTLQDVGLDYLKLGQPSPTLSGGEAQRIKLSRELSRKATGRTVYLLDEPTTGLHFADIKMLLKVLQDLVSRGNTVIVVEHNLDVIKTADWIIDLGPEGGQGGGEIIFSGRPEDLVNVEKSHTGRALGPVLFPKKFKPPEFRKAHAVVPEATHITVEGAQQHNLKSIDLEVPRDKLNVFCGPSGSGKTSLAMDTIYAEGQRRYVESLSAYARQFLGQMQKPKVDRIEGLSPAVALEQRNQGHTPRSTVGTVTEVYDYLRVLFARVGTMHCPRCQIPVGTQTSDQVVDKILAMEEGTRALLLAPLPFGVGEDPEHLWTRLQHDGFVRVRVNGITHAIENPPKLDLRARHRIQVVIDRLIVKASERSRIADSVEQALSIGAGIIELAIANEQLPESDWREVTHSLHLACGSCGRSFQPLTPHHFSFNTQVGWCTQCEGLGTQTGTNPAALLRDSQMKLSEGAMLLWPNMDHGVSRAMLWAFCRQTGIQFDARVDDLTATQRRMFFHGTGAKWFEVTAKDVDAVKLAATDASEAQATLPSGSDRPLFRFQFKGFYPSLEAVAKLSPTLRTRLEEFVDTIHCTACDGSRLREEAAAVRLWGMTMADVVQMPLGTLLETSTQWKPTPAMKKVASELLREIRQRVQFLTDVGLEYLTLGRAAASLSGGESQRIRLAGQLGSGLCGVLYVLDEPTIGLHPRDSGRLLAALQKLRDLGNTLLVVEHDREIIAGSDQLFDFGPLAGRHGGRVVAEGTPAQVGKVNGSVTGPYLSGKKAIPVPKNRRMFKHDGRWEGPIGYWVTVHGARENNLRNVEASIPLGTLCAVTGPSGSGKSSLIDDILYPALAKTFHRARVKPGRHDKVTGARYLNKVIRVDQSPLGNSPTSNPATYSGAFELIRHLYAELPESRMRGFTARQFSFNVEGGRCDKCEGSGQRCIEMHFLPDVWVTCEDCQGKRYKPEILEVKLHGKSISDILEMSISDCLRLFKPYPKIARILQTIADVGLDYVTLGQPAPTLSGGEAQRVKLAAELARPDTGRTLYLLDEPTTGLHFEDVAKLLAVLHRLVDMGNTVVVVEHNLDVIKQSDWILDLGPEAGAGGGYLVAEGPPELIVEHAKKAKTRRPKSKSDTAVLHRSYTGEYLADVLKEGPHVVREKFDAVAHRRMEIIEDLANLQFHEAPVTGVRKRALEWHMEGVAHGGETRRWPPEILRALVTNLRKMFDGDEFDFAPDDRILIKRDGEIWCEVLSKRPEAVYVIARGELASRNALGTEDQGFVVTPLRSSDGVPCVCISFEKLMNEPQYAAFRKLMTLINQANREAGVARRA